ncbi:hypothetical protein [Thalassovita sp.]|uniref:hypothetical protein n=1 Tax=Thalassovita sp. TaxID=1979401 RepID=UPI0029DE783F|nr:hypothetical protein [Thalassovita sp.]
MPSYLIRYRILSGPDPMTPLSTRIEAGTEQAAIAVLKSAHTGQDIRIEKASPDTPVPRKRKSRKEWIILGLIVVIGAVNLASRWLN